MAKCLDCDMNPLARVEAAEVEEIPAPAAFRCRLRKEGVIDARVSDAGALEGRDRLERAPPDRIAVEKPQRRTREVDGGRQVRPPLGGTGEAGPISKEPSPG